MNISKDEHRKAFVLYKRYVLNKAILMSFVCLEDIDKLKIILDSSIFFSIFLIIKLASFKFMQAISAYLT